MQSRRPRSVPQMPQYRPVAQTPQPRSTSQAPQFRSVSQSSHSSASRSSQSSESRSSQSSASRSSQSSRQSSTPKKRNTKGLVPASAPELPSLNESPFSESGDEIGDESDGSDVSAANSKFHVLKKAPKGYRYPDWAYKLQQDGTKHVISKGYFSRVMRLCMLLCKEHRNTAAMLYSMGREDPSKIYAPRITTSAMEILQSGVEFWLHKWVTNSLMIMWWSMTLKARQDGRFPQLLKQSHLGAAMSIANGGAKSLGVSNDDIKKQQDERKARALARSERSEAKPESKSKKTRGAGTQSNKSMKKGTRSNKSQKARSSSKTKTKTKSKPQSKSRSRSRTPRASDKG